MDDSARLTAAQALYDVMEKGAYANLALEKTLRNSALSWADRGLVTEMVNGATRMVRHVDWVLDAFLSRPVSRQQPWLRTVLRISLYQLMFMNKIPAYAAVNAAVALTRRKTGEKLAAVVNGVLRNYLRNKDSIRFPSPDDPSYLGLIYSHPDWLVDRLLGLYGWSQTEQMLSYNNQPPAITVRTNTLRLTRQELCYRLGRDGVQAECGLNTPWSVRLTSIPVGIAGLPSYQAGLFYVQNEGSMLAAPILNPPADQRVYDLCAGIGGKTTHLASLMGNKGVLVACDIHGHKVDLLQGNCQRLGIHNVSTLQADATAVDHLGLEPGAAVLLDAPCSGWGVLNRRADARWRKSQDEVMDLTRLQRKMLRSAAQLVQAGGVLLYCTCTINPEENQQIVEDFLKDMPFYLEGFADRISFFPLDEYDLQQAQKGCLLLLPGKYGCDGMYFALLRRW